MKVNVSEWLGRHIYATGEYEPATTKVIFACLQPGDIFLDVGANAGYFSLLAAKQVGAGGKVLAFEPVPIVREQLLNNIDLNRFKNCRVFDCAASNELGEIEMYVGPADHRGVSSMRKLADASEAIHVRQVRLDDLLASEPRIDSVKIDVEGAECHVLEGMRGLLQRHRPNLILEVTETFLAGMNRSSEDIERLISEIGYEMYAVEHEGLRPLNRLSTYPHSQFNAFFSRPDRYPQSVRKLSLFS